METGQNKENCINEQNTYVLYEVIMNQYHVSIVFSLPFLYWTRNTPFRHSSTGCFSSFMVQIMPNITRQNPQLVYVYKTKVSLLIYVTLFHLLHTYVVANIYTKNSCILPSFGSSKWSHSLIGGTVGKCTAFSCVHWHWQAKHLQF